MAAIPTSLLSLILILFLAAAATGSAAGFDDLDLSKEKKTHLHFFFHEIIAGLGQTSTVVATLHPNSSAPSVFGNLRVFDNALRETVDPRSKLIGRAQGIAVSASLADPSLITTINFVFTEGPFNGSSLALLGRVDGTNGHGDRSVVGGSGRFQLARGFALSKVVNASSLAYIVEFDFYVIHY